MHNNPLDRLFLRLASSFGTFIARNRNRSWSASICRYADQFRYRAENVNFDMESNGEMRVIKLAKVLKPKIVLDVGANIGQWCTRFAGCYPDSRVHTFEPVPLTFERLQANTAQFRNIRNNNFGLSSQQETITLHSTPDTAFDSATTAYPIRGMPFHDRYYTNSLDCAFEKGSDYMAQNRIDGVDFMKIDVEGMEYKVLEGFDGLIDRVRAIQFEYGIFNISSRILLRDLTAMLEGHGFVVGKIYPRYVEFFSYHFDRENFLGNNFIAIKREEAEYIRLLSGVAAG